MVAWEAYQCFWVFLIPRTRDAPVKGFKLGSEGAKRRPRKRAIELANRRSRPRLRRKRVRLYKLGRKPELVILGWDKGRQVEAYIEMIAV